MEVRTWEDLAAKIAALSPEQRKQPIQCVQPTPNDDDVQEMLQGIAIATVDEFGLSRCRSTHDNKHNGGDVVLLMDANPFAEDGSIVVAYELDDKDLQSSSDEPHEAKDYGSNAGIRCDTDDGPCACGAWH